MNNDVSHYQPRENFLKDKIILITGAGDGIGREAAIQYARYGAQIILLGRTEHKLQEVKKAIESEGLHSPLIYVYDLLTLTSQQCHQFADDLAQHFSYLDAVLHNAGLLGVVAPMTEQPVDLWEQVMQVNVNATFMLTQALIPLLLRAKQPSLVFTSSSVGREGRSGWGAYAV